VPIEQLAELMAVVSGGVAVGKGANEALVAVGAQMGLVTEDRNDELTRDRSCDPLSSAERLRPALEGPAAVGIHLRPLRLRPACWHRAAPDGRPIVLA
jgi:hypothetical protein